MPFDPVSYAMGQKSAGGGGGDITVESKSISANGTFTAPPGKAYSPVTVNVPNSYTAGDEGKVVSNGALVAQTSDTVTQNGTVDTTLINSLTVNVSGGGGNVLPSGYTRRTYIQSDGTAYIDTGVPEIAGVLTKISASFDAYTVGTTIRTLFGYQGNPLSDYRFSMRASSTLDYYGAQSGASNAISGWVQGQKNDIEVSFVDDASKPVFTVNGTTSTGSKNKTTKVSTDQGGMYLLAQNYQGGGPGTVPVDGSYSRCYGCQIYCWGGKVRDFVPCTRDADSKAGFYDIETETFYPSIGDSEFTYG